MAKYYRVRTQEQWDWLKNKLEIEDDLHVSNFPVTILYGDVFCGIYKYHDDPEPLIEVSQMMEDDKMEDYVTINSEALKQIRWGTNYGKFGFIDHDEDGENHVYEQYLPANLEIPKFLVYPKVPMTEAEKKEFDLIHEEETLYNALDVIEYYPHLYKRIYEHTPASIPEFELEFARAWADESLIEVIPEKKWNVYASKKYNLFWYKDDVKDVLSGVANLSHNKDSDQQFTQAEIEHYGLQDYERKEVSE